MNILFQALWLFSTQRKIARNCFLVYMRPDEFGQTPSTNLSAVDTSKTVSLRPVLAILPRHRGNWVKWSHHRFRFTSTAHSSAFDGETFLPVGWMRARYIVCAFFMRIAEFRVSEMNPWSWSLKDVLSIFNNGQYCVYVLGVRTCDSNELHRFKTKHYNVRLKPFLVRVSATPIHSICRAMTRRERRVWEMRLDDGWWGVQEIAFWYGSSGMNGCWFCCSGLKWRTFHHLRRCSHPTLVHARDLLDMRLTVSSRTGSIYPLSLDVPSSYRYPYNT